jgi:hypothetical protein
MINVINHLQKFTKLMKSTLRNNDIQNSKDFTLLSAMTVLSTLIFFFAG